MLQQDILQDRTPLLCHLPWLSCGLSQLFAISNAILMSRNGPEGQVAQWHFCVAVGAHCAWGARGRDNSKHFSRGDD